MIRGLTSFIKIHERRRFFDERRGLSNEAGAEANPEISKNRTAERAPAFSAAFWTTTFKCISSLLHKSLKEVRGHV